MTASPATTLAPAPRSAPRDVSLDIYKGIAILEVVAHHLTGFAFGHTAAGSLSHWSYALANRTLHFGVIGFLMLNALLLTRSQTARPRPWGDFYRKQAARLLVPYLIWSLLYLLFRVAAQGESLAGILDRGGWLNVLLWGKAYYHLYFLAILWQFYLLFPLFLALAARFRWGLPAALAAGLAAQAVVLGLYRLAPPPRFAFPSTLALWHVTPLFVGCWLGLRSAELPDLWRRWWPLVVPLTAVALAVQLPLAIRDLRGLPVDTRVLHLSLQVYAVGLGMVVLAVGRAVAARVGAVAGALQHLGASSLAIYLLHPALLRLYGKRLELVGSLWLFSLALLLGGTVIVVLCLWVSNLIRRGPLKGFLLGQ